ncbi:MAG: hypothetical protein M9915_09800 [Rhizobacter sp.]|nr:hypothetical protein [Rhizobacter sp.]
MSIPHSIRMAAPCCALMVFVLAPHVAQAQSRMGAAEAAQLYTAAGFQIIGNRPANRCAKPAQPRVSFVDINGDKRAEALFVDADASCYAPSGRYYAVLVKDGANWRPITSGTGTIQALASRTGGWLDMQASDAGCRKQLHFDGHVYADTTDCSGRALTAAAAPSHAGLAAPVAQGNQQPAPPSAAAPSVTKTATSPEAATNLSPAEEAAAFKSAGLKKRGGQWQSDCGDPGTASYSPGRIAQVLDANGDGLPEAVIDEGSTYCYGGAEHGYWVVSKTAGGAWRLVTSGTGMVEFLKTKGVDGWRDISIGGPGFCFPVQRWNGKAYKLQRWEYEGKVCKPQR